MPTQKLPRRLYAMGCRGCSGRSRQFGDAALRTRRAPLLRLMIAGLLLSGCQAGRPIVLQARHEPFHRQAIRHPVVAAAPAEDVRASETPSSSCDRRQPGVSRGEQDAIFKEFDADQSGGGRPRVASRSAEGKYCRPAG